MLFLSQEGFVQILIWFCDLYLNRALSQLFTFDFPWRYLHVTLLVRTCISLTCSPFAITLYTSVQHRRCRRDVAAASPPRNAVRGCM